MRARSSWLFHCPIKRDARSRLAPPANRHEQAKEIPFTVEQFFGIFAEYNSAVRPAQVPLNGMALAALGLVFVRCHWSGAAVSAILAMLSAQPTGGAHAVVFRQRPGRIPAWGYRKTWGLSSPAWPQSCCGPRHNPSRRPNGRARTRTDEPYSTGLQIRSTPKKTAGPSRKPRCGHSGTAVTISRYLPLAALPGSATARTLLAAMSAVRLSAN